MQTDSSITVDTTVGIHPKRIKDISEINIPLSVFNNRDFSFMLVTKLLSYFRVCFGKIKQTPNFNFVRLSHFLRLPNYRRKYTKNTRFVWYTWK